MQELSLKTWTNLLGGKRVGNETVGGSCVGKDCSTNWHQD